MSDPNLDRINATVRDCLSYCYSRENTLMAMAEYLAVLKTSGKWHDSELSLVRATVTRVLRQLDDGIDTSGPD